MKRGDSLAFYKRGEVHFPNSEKVVHVVKLKANFFKKIGWAFVSEKNTIAQLKYSITDDRLNYQLSANYEKGNKYALLALQIGLGRLDKQINLDYGPTNPAVETIASVLGAMLAVTIFQ